MFRPHHCIYLSIYLFIDRAIYPSIDLFSFSVVVVLHLISENLGVSQTYNCHVTLRANWRLFACGINRSAEENWYLLGCKLWNRLVENKLHKYADLA